MQRAAIGGGRVISLPRRWIKRCESALASPNIPNIIPPNSSTFVHPLTDTCPWTARPRPKRPSSEVNPTGQTHTRQSLAFVNADHYHRPCGGANGHSGYRPPALLSSRRHVVCSWLAVARARRPEAVLQPCCCVGDGTSGLYGWKRGIRGDEGAGEGVVEGFGGTTVSEFAQHIRTGVVVAQVRVLHRGLV